MTRKSSGIRTVTLPDGYNGDTVDVMVSPIDEYKGFAKFPVNSAPWMMRYESVDKVRALEIAKYGNSTI